MRIQDNGKIRTHSGKYKNDFNDHSTYHRMTTDANQKPPHYHGKIRCQELCTSLNSNGVNDQDRQNTLNGMTPSIEPKVHRLDSLRRIIADQVLSRRVKAQPDIEIALETCHNRRTQYQ